MPRPDTQELACSGVAPTACAAASTTGRVPPTPATVATSAAVAVETRPDLTKPPYAFARSTIACSRIWQPAPMSALVASSISLWLMPSLHGTKTMAVGATRET